MKEFNGNWCRNGAESIKSLDSEQLVIGYANSRQSPIDAGMVLIDWMEDRRGLYLFIYFWLGWVWFWVWVSDHVCQCVSVLFFFVGFFFGDDII